MVRLLLCVQDNNLLNIYIYIYNHVIVKHVPILYTFKQISLSFSSKTELLVYRGGTRTFNRGVALENSHVQSTCENFDHVPFFTNYAHLSAEIKTKTAIKFKKTRLFLSTNIMSDQCFWTNWWCWSQLSSQVSICMWSWLVGGGCLSMQSAIPLCICPGTSKIMFP